MTSYDDVLHALAERTIENRQQLKRSKTQRRVTFVDLYGVPYTAQGDANHPATFYISVSPDLGYYERFSFKLIIQPFKSSVSGISLSDLSIGNTALTLNEDYIADGTSTLYDGTLTPNPHTHTASGGSGGVSYGVNQVSTTSTNWRMRIHGVDITAYLMAQHDGDWITGEGIFPTNRITDEEDFYDILDVACLLNEEGRISDRDKLLAPEFKQVEIISDAPFSVTAYLYMKISNTNR